MTSQSGPSEPDEVTFGPGNGAGSRPLNAPHTEQLEAGRESAASHFRGELPAASDPDPVDTWFEQEPAPSSTSRDNTVSRAPVVVERHHTSILLGLWSMTAIAIVAAAIGWSGQDSPAMPAAGGETHGLTPDQAACFAYGRIEGRVNAGPAMPDPVVRQPQRHTISTEVTSLDTLGQAYPSADYRLIAAFAGVADASVRIQTERDPAQVRHLVSARVATLATAESVCRDVASYDVKSASPT